jgi:hypothetical protein
MRRRNLAFLLACAGLLFAAAATAPAALEPAAPAGNIAMTGFGVATTGVGADAPLSEPDACPPLPPSTGDQFTPMACKIAPECSTNDDCTAVCGPNGGRCVHSKCPIRICKCN